MGRRFPSSSRNGTDEHARNPGIGAEPEPSRWLSMHHLLYCSIAQKTGGSRLLSSVAAVSFRLMKTSFPPSRIFITHFFVASASIDPLFWLPAIIFAAHGLGSARNRGELRCSHCVLQGDLPLLLDRAKRCNDARENERIVEVAFRLIRLRGARWTLRAWQSSGG